MNIAEFSIRKSVITWLMVVIFLVGGGFAYFNLGRYEDPEFTIKDAMVITQYPGGTPIQVEQEVTEKIEKNIQTMGQVKRMESISTQGLSQITVTMKDKYGKHDLPQVWDELRRKVNDIIPELPPGTHKPVVLDDYGDVFGIFYAVTGDGFGYKDIKDYTDMFKRELSLVPGVAKVEVEGERQEAIFVDISRARMSQLGISLEQIYKTLQSQNLVVPAGNVRVGDEYIRISPTGGVDSVQSISNLVIRSNTTKKMIYLSDIAKITRGYTEVPSNLMYFDGKPALGMGVSIVPGGNIVKIGAAVEKRIAELQDRIPIGIQLNNVYMQPKLVQASINAFVISLLEALAIVVVVLLLFMGLRSGLIIGGILWLSVIGTLFVMYLFSIDLERISLGALIIALGMLVDNAIVVAEGILIKVNQGIDKIKAARDVVTQTMWPLLGATIVGILAFAAIGLSEDSTGEYTASLFYVILISLILSWVFAVMVTPVLCNLFLKPGNPNKQQKDPYAGFIYQGYKRFLWFCIKVRWITIAVCIGLLFFAVYGFKYVDQSFFPNSTTPLFYVNYWRSQGTDIRATAEDMKKIQKHISSLPGVASVTSVVGKGALRFTLVYAPEKANSSYGQFLVEVKNFKDIDKLGEEIKQYLIANFPDSEPKIEKLRLGPGGGAKIEARFSGPNPAELRKLSQQAQDIMHTIPNAIDIRDDWRHKVKLIIPEYSETQARLTGITRQDLADALETAFSGKTVGIYREDDKLIPIISRPPDKERLNIANIDDLQIWSPMLSKTVPVGQIVTGFKTKWEDAIIRRRNRKRTITASCEPAPGIPASVVFDSLQPRIEAMKLPTGYEMKWGGEYEDSHDAQVALAAKLPVGILTMIIVVILLFAKIRQPLIIWLCVPLSFIGVTAGLLLTHMEFGFMALLGFLSLSGMLIKNAIVLVDQIDTELAEGKEPFTAIMDSCVSRMRPVMLAAITTVLGMIPLVFDVFFASMAVTIMFGLTFATILTLIVVPVLYAVFFRIKTQPFGVNPDHSQIST